MKFVPLLPTTLLINAATHSCIGFSIKVPQSSSTKRSAPMITASDEKDPDITFDSACVANPVVLPPCNDGDKWQCYYYGNSGSWSKGHRSFLPTGSSGLAESDNGLTSWTKIAGQRQEGALLSPSDDIDAWDAVQTGVGDVVRITKDELHMYYFGGSNEELPMGPNMKIAGFRMRIGRAKSSDNGRTWVKDDSYLLDYDEAEGLFASWPRIVVPKDESEAWKMYYHSFNGQKWRVYGAESHDKGDSWTRTGLVLEGSNEEDAFDYSGIGTRDVTPWRGGLLMIYEGVDKGGKHCLGAAFCDDKYGNAKWTKLNDGKPILEPGKSPLGAWTSKVIGTPYVVSLPDGSLRIYHCGKDEAEDKMKIGVVVSESGDVAPESWMAV